MTDGSNREIDKDIPIRFGRDGDAFGMYAHTSDTQMPAVLLCPPFGLEMIRTHRLYRQLAQALHAGGMPVLRFDYRCTGDAGGDSRELSLQHCIEDTLDAVRELRARSSSQRVTVFGARLGATTAMQAAKEAGFERLVLWDPVLDGQAYVRSQDALQEALPLDCMRFPKPRTPADVAGQWLGFEVSNQLRKELSEMQVPTPSASTLILDSRLHEDGMARDALAATKHATVIRIQPSTEWNSLDRLEHAILLPALVQATTKYLLGTA